VDQLVDCKDNWLKIACFRTAGQRITVHGTYTSIITLVNFYLEEDCVEGEVVFNKKYSKRNPVLDNSYNFFMFFVRYQWIGTELSIL
jgi:hypothetical protein